MEYGCLLTETYPKRAAYSKGGGIGKRALNRIITGILERKHDRDKRISMGFTFSHQMA